MGNCIAETVAGRAVKVKHAFRCPAPPRPLPCSVPEHLLATSERDLAINPSANIIFLDGQLQPALNLATNVAIKLGVATGGPMLAPTLCSQTSSVLQFLHGPLVASGAQHVTYSGPVQLMRINAGTNGAIGSVTKTPATTSPASLGSMTAALTGYTLRDTVDASVASAALNLTSGWTSPSAPLYVTVTSGAGTVAHVQTFTYVDSAGDTQTGTLSISAAGTATTTFAVASIISVTSNIAPVGTQAYAATFTSPGDRYYAKVKTINGGVLGVTGGTTPNVQVSLDNGLTYSRTFSLLSSGVFELSTYAGGLTPQATGVTMTFAAGTLASEVYGSLRVAGATTPGDVVYTKVVSSAVTVTHVVAGVSTAFSVAVVGPAITVNSATDGGGLATSTANDVVAGIEGSVAASALVTAVAVGAGTGLVAAAGSAGFANSGVAYTPKVEGVTVRHGNPGASNATLTVVTLGKAVTVNPVTDSNGVQTSTATQVETAVNADATASLLLTADATGSGAGVVGMQATYQALAVSAATGDAWTFATTPPTWSQVDLAAALVSLYSNEAALDGFSIMHILGSCVDLDVTNTQAWLDSLAANKRKYKAAYHEATYMGSTTESTWLAAVLAGYTQIDTDPKVGLCAGEVNTLNPAYGTVDRRNISTAYISRLMICSISELPSHVDCTTDLGIQNSLNGVVTRTAAAGQSVAPLFQSEDTLVSLNNANFVTFRTLPGRTGIYVRQGLMFAIDGSDYLYVTNRRTADVVAAVAYNEIIRNLNANLLVDTRTGQLASVEVARIEKNVEDAIRRQVMGGARQHISGVRCIIDPATNYQATGAITGQVSIVGRTPATFLTLSIGYVRTLPQ